ncbi:PREDICTED: F-box/kelch-repeat protein At3g06240-like [Erythranthe guttata]|uniref:F-box/kelch-repeat protein At3g06240-like n=1 Tax=Erythranthe guttata TaxID=4155 RepID=UPI00064D9347|nr:PREDICTED: F-box/kelch-repeat protein At3g06240-like [Erythranthe guttata]|eukprot:XP_012844259.1 PREDICTED: F-box/kelch-repeat protein At3g06240-like [Erythranthe guttata]
MAFFILHRRSCSLSSLLENSTATISDRHPTDHIYDRISEDADADANYFHRYYCPYYRYPEMMTSTTIGDDGNPNNDGFGILGSCNGLTLVTIGMRDLFMWNPTTRQAKKIVPPESHCFTDGFKNIRRRSFLYGLGYVESTDEYKIVCIFFSYMNHRPTEIYSSRTGSWKKIQNFDNEFTFNGNKEFINGKFVNGKFHWLIKHNNGGKWDIVALDLSEEKYEIVGRPPNFPDRTHSQHSCMLWEAILASLVITK